MRGPDPPEEWRAVVGYEGLYDVSNHGRVQSLARVVMRRNGVHQTIPGRQLKTPTSVAGYPVVGLWRGNNSKTRTVHSLVAEAFIGPRPPGMEVCHGSDGPQEPGIWNLRYDTHQQNLMDTIRQGTNSRVTRECPLGHLKSQGNAILYGPFNTRTRCRACKNEQVASAKGGRPFSVEEADRRYRDYMNGDK